ncbi:MAG: hypothetical protein R3B99_22740 [Polyangiales bacterium]
MGFAHAGMDGLHDVIPFHTARATHTNLLVMETSPASPVAAYFIIPEECERELYWPMLAKVQLVALVVVGVTAIIGFHVGWFEGRSSSRFRGHSTSWSSSTCCSSSRTSR